MSNANKLAVYTVPSNFVNPLCRPMARPYQRVVGVESDGGKIWVEPESWIDPKGRYSQKDAEEVLIPSNPLFAGLLAEFVVMYQTKGPSYLDANCHRFGRWVRRSVAAALPQGLDVPNDVVAEGFRLPAGRRLKLMQIGVIGHKKDGQAVACHSTVGLGVDDPRTINVIADQGHIGLLGYDELDHYLPSFADSEAKDTAQAGLYV